MVVKSQGKIRSVTVIDVAKKAGVSKSTVSLVLTGSIKVSDSSKDKVLKAIKATGYVYNRDAASLRSRKSNLVAIVLHDLTNPFAGQLAVGLEQHIRNIGLFSMIVNSGESVDRQTELVQSLKEYNVAAFIICPAPGTKAQWINNLVEQGFPVITIMRKVSGANVTTIIPDNVKGTELATQHMLAKGYRKLAFLGGKEDISDYHERLLGFKQAMLRAGVAFSPQQCFQSGTTRNSGRSAMEQALTHDPDIDAIVCFSDVIAYGAIEQMRLMGKTPGKDIAVVGFDDLQDSCLMSPSLTTVHIEASKIGGAVSELLKSKLVDSSAETKESTIFIDVNLNIRDSS